MQIKTTPRFNPTDYVVLGGLLGLVLAVISLGYGLNIVSTTWMIATTIIYIVWDIGLVVWWTIMGKRRHAAWVLRMENLTSKKGE